MVNDRIFPDGPDFGGTEASAVDLRAGARCNRQRVTTVFGTRPKAITLRPTMRTLEASALVDAATVVTGHRCETFDQASGHSIDLGPPAERILSVARESLTA